MSDEDLEKFVLDLQSWFGNNIKAITKAAEDTKDENTLTVVFQGGGGDDIKLELKTPEEVKAYRIGLYSAMGVMGEFPVSITRKSEEVEDNED